MDSEVRELGQVCTFQRGLTYAKGDEVDQSRNVVLRANNISMLTNALDFTELKYIKDSITIPESKLVRRDTLMICTASGSKSHLGKVAYVDKDYGYAFGGFMGLLVPEDEVYARYVYYSMLSENYKEFIGDLSDGTNINNLKWDDLKLFTLPVPPLSEQYRIVSKLDAAFAALGEAEANVERNRANARELFESYLNGVFEGKGWKKVRLGDVLTIERGGSPRPIQDFLTDDPDGLNWVKISDATASDKYIYRTKEKIRPEGLKKSRFVEVDDFLLSNSMSFGRPYIMKTTGCIHDGWLVLKQSETVFDQDFLYYLLSSRYVFNQFDTLASGSTVRNLNTQLVSRVVVHYPSITEQRRVAGSIEEIYNQVKQLESTYQQKLDELAALKKGLLGAAFRGEL